MKLAKILTISLALVLLLTACNKGAPSNVPTAPDVSNAVEIVLSDKDITVDGKTAGSDKTEAVYVANDIVYYESGKDFTYGEGSEKDAHSPEEAAAHRVVHITQPGAYSINGKLSLGQIAVDLGKDAKENPEAVVTLVLNGVDITCEVAPAVIFYNVYECGNDDTEKATKDVDTSAAGANVIIADGTVNTVKGSYVERIYKPDSVVLNDDKTEVLDADKLHKYDGAFYSKRSMNIFGGKKNNGVLNIVAENEGLDSEMHLTINGGNISIQSGNDGINTNEDGVSVTTINGGSLKILVTGETGEGDGIDSNGWLVINGGTVTASACATSGDAGIDSDMGIHINGGTVIATGHMLDRIEDGGQNYAVFTFAQKQNGSETVVLKSKDGKAVLETKPENGYSILVYSSPDLKADTYTLWSDGTQLAGSAGNMDGSPMQPGGQQPESGNPVAPPEGGTPPEMPEGGTPPEGGNPPEMPEGDTPPEGGNPPEMPEGGNPPEPPQGGMGGNRPGGNNGGTQSLSPDFTIRDGGNMFSNIQAVKAE